MNMETVALVSTIFVAAGAVGFSGGAIVYGFWGRWRETAVGFWYLVDLAIVGGALWIVLFARQFDIEIRTILFVVVYGLFAVGGAGTLPTIAHAVYKERKRRKQNHG